MSLFPPNPSTDGEQPHRSDASGDPAASVEAAWGGHSSPTMGGGVPSQQEPWTAQPTPEQAPYPAPSYVPPVQAPVAYTQPGYGPGPVQPGYQPMYAYPSVYAAQPKPAGPPATGWIGLALGVLALLISVVADVVTSQAIKDSVANKDNYAGVDAFVYGLVPQLVATAVGIAGFVVSIVGTAQNRGRTQGILGIVISTLAPMISYVVFIALMVAAVGTSDYGPTLQSTTGA